jgi:hypothetical protein
MKKLDNIKQKEFKQIKNLFYFENGILRYKRLFIVVLMLYSISAIILFNYYQYILVSDGVSYITIAKEYTLQHYDYAVNGYWSPLFTWLLTPFLIFGTTPMYMMHSAKILSLIIGLITLIGLNSFFSKFITDDKLKIITILTLVPSILFFAFYLVTPDLLLICVLVFYFNLIFDPNYSSRLSNGFACGILGALAYFSKSYAFFFFICHFVVFNLYFYLKNHDQVDRTRIKKNCIVGLIIFLALTGIWIGLISDKYHEITIGTAGSYNQAVMGPESLGHPPLYQGLISPPNPIAVSSWEDPSSYQVKQWSPFESIHNFYYELNLIVKNIIKTIGIFINFSILSPLILFGALLFILRNKRDEESKIKLIYLLGTIFIFAAGYCLVFIEERYLWLMLILMLLTGVYLIEALLKNRVIEKETFNLLLIILIASFLVMPLISLHQNINVDKQSYQDSISLKNDYNVHGRIASNNEWIYTSVLSYFMETIFYGQTKQGEKLIELEKELKDNNIDYYFVWGVNQTDLPYKEITGGKFYHLKVYSLRNDTN